ncbi:MAG: thioredoxin family protein [Tissierellaceae bacterium]|nr:thioredoxin family protein [Tissierellaceae bacterium]
MLNKLDSMELIEQLVKENDMALLYFSGENCGVCKSIRPKVEEILATYPKIKGAYIDVENHPHLGVSYSIFTIPSIVFFIEGKETLRESRHLSIQELDNKINRYYSLLFE